MNLEIHKASPKAESARIDISEVFPDHYEEVEKSQVCEDEARALYDALKTILPEETKAELVRMFSRDA
jgi:hypothetical protein